MKYKDASSNRVQRLQMLDFKIPPSSCAGTQQPAFDGNAHMQLAVYITIYAIKKG